MLLVTALHSRRSAHSHQRPKPHWHGTFRRVPSETSTRTTRRSRWTFALSTETAPGSIASDGATASPAQIVLWHIAERPSQAAYGSVSKACWPLSS
jgi:hypothetical protein